MAYKFVLGHHIKQILNDVQDKQKQDIKDYTSGHLNESLLLRTCTDVKHQPWTSAHVRPPSCRKPPGRSRGRKLKGKKSPTEVLCDFVLGSAGLQSTQNSSSELYEIYNRPHREGTREQELSRKRQTNRQSSLYSQLDDGILVEELTEAAPHLTYFPPHQGHREEMDAPHGQTENLYTEAARLSPGSQEPASESHQFPLPKIEPGITSKDKYKNMKTFDDMVLQRADMVDASRTLTGEKSAKDYDLKLQHKLANLFIDCDDVIQDRLRICGDILDDISRKSYCFSHLLNCIHTEYDNYISHLLDKQTLRTQDLHDQIQQVTPRVTSQDDELSSVAGKLESLEAETKALLDQNLKLQAEVKAEKNLANLSPEVPVRIRCRPDTSPAPDTQADPAVDLENMKILILEKLDELNTLRLQTRADYVPVTVCVHLEQCMTETEVEVQKLLKQNEYFERSLAEMESELKEAIIEADTSEKDARRIWSKVNSTRRMPGVSTAEYKSDDDDDESKWDWYIS